LTPKGYELKFCLPLDDPETRGGKPPVYRRSVEHGMIVERDLAVTLRTGIKVYVDLFRPADGKPAAPLIAWSPYGKHTPNDLNRFPNAGINPNHLSPYTPFEGPDPLYWVPRGYAVIVVDKPGTWYSEGRATYLSPEEAQDFYDVIEWAGTQPWSNGKVGLTGVSYLAQTQWRVAELNPPHLAAMNPWEGWSDTYREAAGHGGMFDSWFWPFLCRRWSASSTEVEDLIAETREHPFFDAFWQSKAADFSKIKAPAFIVASWTDQGLHTRGTVEGFKKIASGRKWLEIHGRKKWGYYYEPESVKRLQAFFDHFLKGAEGTLDGWPKVRLEIRERYCAGEIRNENEWPIARTNYTKLYLAAQHGALQREPLREAGTFKYDAVGQGPDPVRAQFEFTFAERTDLIGNMKLKLYLSVVLADDADIFVGIQKLDRDGKIVPFAYYAQFDDGPVALGWLRASHRELDLVASTEYQPVHTHQRPLKLEAGEVVPLDIEIWPSGTRFEAGDKLRLIVQGTDINKYSKEQYPVYFRHEDTVNKGLHVIHTGGEHDSHLLVPVVPAR